jgi:hypothetical protein
MQKTEQKDPLDIGEHGWRVHERDELFTRLGRQLGDPEPQVDHQSIRVRAGWEREVAHIVVNSDVNGEPYLSVSKQEKLKTKQLYRERRGGVDLHNAEDFRRFMQAMQEAGERAGWV